MKKKDFDANTSLVQKVPFLGWLIISKTRSFLAFDTINISFSSICYPIFPSFSLKSKT